MLHYALYRLQLAHAMGECILRHGGSDTLFPNDFEEDLLLYVLDLTGSLKLKCEEQSGFLEHPVATVWWY